MQRAQRPSAGASPPWKLAPTQCSTLIGRDFRCVEASADRPDRRACQINDVALAKKVCSRRRRCSAIVVNKEKTWATLKHSWRWGVRPPESHTDSRYDECRRLARDAYDKYSCDARTDGDWATLGCSEYLEGTSELGERTRPFPQLMRPTLAPGAPRNATQLRPVDDLREPAAVPDASRFEVLTLANRGSAGLCRLMRSAVLHDVPLTVLGWEPEAQSRWQEFYLASKALMSALYIGRRRQGGCNGSNRCKKDVTDVMKLSTSGGAGWRRMRWCSSSTRRTSLFSSRRPSSSSARAGWRAAAGSSLAPRPTASREKEPLPPLPPLPPTPTASREKEPLPQLPPLPPLPPRPTASREKEPLDPKLPEAPQKRATGTYTFVPPRCA